MTPRAQTFIVSSILTLVFASVTVRLEPGATNHVVRLNPDTTYRTRVVANVGFAQAGASDAIVPFKIHVPDDVLADLKQRLARTRFPDEIPGTDWEYGTNLRYLKELVTYWRDKFDWRAQERRLNELEQFKTTIDGVTIHFVHRRSKQPNAMPLAITHGWPGSFFEVTKVIGPLTDPVAHGGPANDAFHVVAMSLPGFAFSDKPQSRGYGPERMSRILATLMARLGYARYGVQGGDWGSAISRLVAINDANHVAGLHMNFCLANPPPGQDPNAGASPIELERARARQTFLENERGYFLEQSTKPQTVGYGLNDSPAGLAAWIVEKFRTWCDCGGDVEKKFTKDDLLTNVMLYWATGSITSSARIYFENQRDAPQNAKVEVPTACAVFPKEISLPPRRWVEGRYNLTRWTEMPRGGHFAALEEPGLLVDDIRAFFRTVR
jgi:epoxide hydrolase